MQYTHTYVDTKSVQVFSIHNGDAPRGLGTTPHVHQPHHQRSREPDPHARLQGHHAGTAHRVPRLIQPLRQEPHRYEVAMS